MWKITKKDGSTVEIERDNSLVICINELNNESDLDEILKIERCEDFTEMTCEHCSKSVVTEYTCNNKAIIKNNMPTEDYFWCDGERFVERKHE